MNYSYIEEDDTSCIVPESIVGLEVYVGGYNYTVTSNEILNERILTSRGNWWFTDPSEKYNYNNLDLDKSDNRQIQNYINDYFSKIERDLT